MLDKLVEFFKGVGTEKFLQNQNEAILLMLVWTMWADGKIEPEESDKLAAFIRSVPWLSETTPEEYIAESTERVKQVQNGQLAPEVLLKEIESKLKGDEIRYKALKVCHELSKADGYFDRSEIGVLKLFSGRLF